MPKEVWSITYSWSVCWAKVGQEFVATIFPKKYWNKSSTVSIVGLCVEPGWNRVVHSADYARLLHRKPSKRSVGFLWRIMLKAKTEIRQPKCFSCGKRPPYGFKLCWIHLLLSWKPAISSNVKGMYLVILGSAMSLGGFWKVSDTILKFEDSC